MGKDFVPNVHYCSLILDMNDYINYAKFKYWSRKELPSQRNRQCLSLVTTKAKV